MLFKLISKRKKKKVQEKSKYNFDINNWMELTKEERFEIDSKENIKIMRKKKALLKSIRDQYIKIKNKNN
tara:strand:+ start:408 stop:617 length:210 start_codon:yes stop_codon:yes gene_type:complete